MIDFYALTSPNVQKVFIMLEELGLPYTMKPVDVWAGQQYDPEFLKGSKTRPWLSMAAQGGLRSLPPEVSDYIDRLKRERGL